MMSARKLVTSGLAVAFVGACVVGYFAIGNPSKAATAAQQTTTVQRGTVSSAVTASGNAAGRGRYRYAYDVRL